MRILYFLKRLPTVLHALWGVSGAELIGMVMVGVSIKHKAKFEKATDQYIKKLEKMK